MRAFFGRDMITLRRRECRTKCHFQESVLIENFLRRTYPYTSAFDRTIFIPLLYFPDISFITFEFHALYFFFTFCKGISIYCLILAIFRIIMSPIFSHVQGAPRIRQACHY